MNTDIFIFMGQSNMAGRGEAQSAVSCPLEAGYEYRVITDPEHLHSITEPFGVNENVSHGIDDSGRKIGGMVSSFVKTYYQKTGRKIIAVSASQGGTSSDEWCSCLVRDAADRLRRTREFLQEQKIAAEHIYMVWCQGESDGDAGVTADQYKKNFAQILEIMQAAGTQMCFLIQIGHFNYAKYPDGWMGKSGMEREAGYRVIRMAQEEICRERQEVVMAGSFAGYLHAMKDMFHYRQEAYNEVGKAAAEAAAEMAAAFAYRR